MMTTSKEVFKKPLKKDYCKPFVFDTNNKDLVSFDSKGYAKAAAIYIEQIEEENKRLKDAILHYIDSVTKDNGLFANHTPFYLQMFRKIINP